MLGSGAGERAHARRDRVAVLREAVEARTHSFPLPSLSLPSLAPSLSALALRTHAHALRSSLAPSHQVRSFSLFSLYLRAVCADIVSMYRTFLLSSALLALDICAIRAYALQPEALIFAALGFATLPFFLFSALAIRGE